MLKVITVLGTALLTLASLTQASYAERRSVDLASNSDPVFVELFYTYDPADCSLGHIMNTSIAQPKSGILFLKYVPTEIVKGHCRGKSVQALGIFYQAAPGFAGRARGKVRFQYSTLEDSVINRRSKTFTITANVQ